MSKKWVNVDDLKAWADANAVDCEQLAPSDDFKMLWPVSGFQVVTQWYGINPQFYPGQAGHEGIDLRAPNGTPIFAVDDGTVYRVNAADTGAYGVHVRIEHPHPAGPFKSVYAHFQKALVNEGEQVLRGETIGLADNTGNSSGPHLHLTLKKVGDGSPWMNLSDIVNPVPYMPDLFPGDGWQLDVGGNFRTAPDLNNNPIRFISANQVVQATGKFQGDWWEIIHLGVKGWFWNPGYKLRAL